MLKFKIGDKVRFVGNADDYIVSHQRALRRVGEITAIRAGINSNMVAWLPKTKRGRVELSNHCDGELELMEPPCK